MRNHTVTKIIVGVVFIGIASFSYFVLPNLLSSEYYNNDKAHGLSLGSISKSNVPQETIFIATHIETPEYVRAIYMTQCVAGTKGFRKNLVALAEETEINSIIIDIKDYTGRISFKSDHPLLKDSVSTECYVRDMREFIADLHERGIYVIGRITVFQDPYYSKKYPNQAVQKESDKSVWEDYKGLSFIDPGAKDAWEYIIALSQESYKEGFDELNYDYIRFPSDGDMNDIYFPFSEERIMADHDYGKANVLREFFEYLDSELEYLGVPLSADLFGMTMTNPDDLNIGQILEYIEPFFDYIAPMVYPSHYPPNFNGWGNPNEHVYDIVKYSMDKGVERMILATSSPNKLRPWLQDFSYGGVYGPEEVRAQIEATYDAGLNSWMLWDPANTYTREALLSKAEVASIDEMSSPEIDQQ